MIDYRLDLSECHAHRFLVTMRCKPTTSQIRLSLPVWIPGSYLVREFARHLNGLQAMQGQQSCPIEQLDKATWQVNCKPGHGLVVTYEVYAFDSSVRTAYLDSRRGFFNGTSVFLRVQEMAHLRHTVALNPLPKGWDVATSLQPLQVKAGNQKKSAYAFEAAHYDELVDHPVEMGHFWRGQFAVRGVPHELVITGAAPSADLDRLLKETQRICETQMGFWHGRRKPVFDRYVFLLNVVDEGYGGLEHRNSTALVCSRRDLPRQDAMGKPSEPTEGHTTLLGLISHEYFHTWNVKRLKPKEFAAYDYTQENYTRMLWFFEGFTSYYDDLCLLRAGLITPATYLKLLSKTINQVLASPGRHVQSTAQASFDAWTRYYRPDENTANSTVSYYTKGAMLALSLDLSLRTLQPGSTLDHVMQGLWALDRPIEESDIAQALQATAPKPPAGFKDWQDVLTHWVHGTDDLPLPELLAHMGVKWTTATTTLSQRIGVRLSESPQGLKVSAVMRGSPAEAAGLSAGDELVALDDWRLKRADDWQTLVPSPSLKPLLISRDQRLITLTLPVVDTGPTKWCQVVSLSQEALPESSSASSAIQRSAQLGRRREWLGC